MILVRLAQFVGLLTGYGVTALNALGEIVESEQGEKVVRWMNGRFRNGYPSGDKIS